MARNKPRRPGRFEVEWVTVSYRTLAGWSSVILAVVALVAVVYVGVHVRDAGRQRSVERLVLSVERDLRAARGARVGAEESAELRTAADGVQQARAALRQGDLGAARAAAEGARESLRSVAGDAEQKAHILRIEGDVNIKRTGSLEWVDARVGSPLGAGDLVRTGAGSAAQIVNLDGSLVTLKADTILRIERSEKDRVSGKTDVAVVVNSGQLAISTGEGRSDGSTSEIRTATARAAIERRTVVGVGVDPAGGQSHFDVLEGQARVSSGSSVIDSGASERLDVSASGGLDRRRLPGIPQLLSPPQYKLLLLHDLQGKPVELEWESARDARAYRVELSRAPLFAQLYRQWESEARNYVVVGELPVGRYYWRVAAIDRESVVGGPSTAGIFQITDVLPVGEPPPLEISSNQALGEGMYLLEGKTSPGVVVTFDDGSHVVAIQPGRTGQFRQFVNFTREGSQVLTITARNSEGLERRVVRRVEVTFQ